MGDTAGWGWARGFVVVCVCVDGRILGKSWQVGCLTDKLFSSNLHQLQMLPYNLS